MDELTKLFSPSCWVPGKTRDEVMNEFFADIQNAYTSLKDDTSIPRKEDISYSEGESQKIDIWGEVKDKLFIFIHGGYWAAGSRKDCVTPAQCALSNGFAFASIGYRLAIGGFTIDDCVRDVVNGLKFLLSEFPNVTTFVVGGHSAGAHLAFHAVTQIRDPRIQGLILFSGCYFLNELVETEIGTEISLTNDQAERISCDVSNLRELNLKTMVILALNEALKLIEQNREFCRQVEQAELVEFPNGSHYSIVTNMTSETSGEYQAVSKFLNSFS